MFTTYSTNLDVFKYFKCSSISSIQVFISSFKAEKLQHSYMKKYNINQNFVIKRLIYKYHLYRMSICVNRFLKLATQLHSKHGKFQQKINNSLQTYFNKSYQQMKICGNEGIISLVAYNVFPIWVKK